MCVMRNLYFAFYVLIAMSSVVGCGGSNIDTIEKNEEHNQLTYEDVSGVWIDPANNFHFLSLSENGRYALCFDRYTMGSGTYVLTNNEIILNNGYLHTSDKLSIAKEQNSLIIKGDMLKYKSTSKTYISKVLNKSNEEISPSMIGVIKQPDPNLGSISGGGKYSKKEIVITYNTEYTATYKLNGKLSSTKQWVIIEEAIWFYVYRTPYTYTQSPAGDGEIIIYYFDDKLGWDDLDKYRIEW